MSTPPAERPIVFFDGVCGLCNAAVDLLLRHDRREAMLFAPLQGETAGRLLGTTENSEFDTFVVWEGGQKLERSDAALRLAHHLGGWWQFWLVFRVVPRPMRDLVYRFVARNRLRWFGKKESCRMPTPAERARFLP